VCVCVRAHVHTFLKTFLYWMTI